MEKTNFSPEEIEERAEELLEEMKKRARGIVAGRDGRFNASSLAISAWPVVQFRDSEFESLDHLMRFAYVVMSKKMMNRIRREAKYGQMEAHDLLASEPAVMKELAIAAMGDQRLQREAVESLAEFRQRLVDLYPDKPKLIKLFELLGGANFFL
jgi:hypothetical protein